MKTAQQLAEELAVASNQGTAYTADDATVGMWSVDRGRYEAVYSKTLIGAWEAHCSILVNGKLPARTWIPTTLTLDLDPDVLAGTDTTTHNHESAPDDSVPTCPVCHYPGWQEDEAYEAARLVNLTRWQEQPATT